MTTSTQPLFIRNGNAVVNASTATTLTHNGDFTLLLDDKCQKVAFDQSEGASELFERVKNAIKPHEKYALKLENGGFIDARIISTVFVSPKTGNLVIVGLNDRPLCVLDAKTFSDLDGLTEVILDALVSVGEGEKFPAIEWSAYKAQ
ncbi:hypothetical protein LH710_003328 [Vibrio vulnificus]|uniref:hypothetical protein n=1 Tax=Vibrio vulnificus TaxID=672 RepID=UPI00163C75D3|nr:hypothetical protein [Vibrio vulnificus]EIJ0947435.1 hypothetical protein [Vibrio vulnificus]QNE02076.1 hypothetical protein H6S61_06810 [Vibrio vulnificus]